MNSFSFPSNSQCHLDAIFLSRSKKISKNSPLHCSDSSSPNSNPKKDYDKTSDEERKAIMLALIEEIVINMTSNAVQIDLENNDELTKWRKYLDGIHHTDYNKILLAVLPRFKPQIKLSQEKLTQWRKKVKGWFDTPVKRCETRGGGLIRRSELPMFKEALKKVIKRMHTMKSRSFTFLRQEILPSIEEIHRLAQDRKPKKNMFSKKFWNEFIHDKDNVDIKTLWNRIPKKSSKYHDGDESDFESEQDGSMGCSQEDTTHSSQGFQEIPENGSYSLTSPSSEMMTFTDNMTKEFSSFSCETAEEQQRQQDVFPVSSEVGQMAGGAVFACQNEGNFGQYYLQDLDSVQWNELVEETDVKITESQVDLLSFLKNNSFETWLSGDSLQGQTCSDFWKNNFGEGAVSYGSI